MTKMNILLANYSLVARLREKILKLFNASVEAG